MAQKRNLPDKDVVKRYWSDQLVALEKFDCFDELMEADYCFACGFYWGKEPGRNNITERAHILPRCKGGSDGPENIHLLCPTCHHDSELIDGERYWAWFKERSVVDATLSAACASGVNLSRMLVPA